jgi:uncharacterized protein (DUF58 family)
MTPTTRCAWLLAGVAVAGLLLPAWATVAGVIAVLAAMLVDGLAVRQAPRVEREAQAVLSRGVPSAFSVAAITRDARRVLLRQPATAALEVRAQHGARSLKGEIVPISRGRHSLPGVAGASVGPLGLARWHHAASPASELLVYPDLQSARRLALRLRQGRAASEGQLRRGPLGLGTDFESIREYSVDDDIRQLNWRASARLGRPMSNQYRIEQDRDVVCVLDAGRLMAAPSADGTLLDLALDAATAVALAADELGDRCGAIAFDSSIRRTVQPRRLGGRRVVKALFDLQPTLDDSDFERAFLRVGGSRRGLVFVFTDLIDERAARSLVRATPVLARRHAVVVASVGDPALEQLAAAGSEEISGDTGEGRGTLEHRAELSSALAALSVLQARAGAVARIRRGGAEVVLAPARSLPERCVQAYLRAKARARL